MAKIRNIASVVLLVISALIYGAETAIWQADLSSNGQLPWDKTRINEDDSAEIKDGELILHCSPQPINKGALYRIIMPEVEAGRLCFEAYPNADHLAPTVYSNMSLYVRFSNLLISFSPNYWTRFVAERGSKSMCPAPRGQWIKCMVAFDRKKEMVSYYCDDMEVPVFVDHALAISSPLHFTVGNYGLAQGQITNKLRNIRLLPAIEHTERHRSGAMILRGIDYEHYDLAGMLAGVTGKQEQYSTLTKLGEFPLNKLAIDRYPCFSIVHPAVIIMADMPFNGTLDGKAIDDLVSEVKSGAKLLILGGFFTLNKGEFKGTHLENELPVLLGTPWDVRVLPEDGRHPLGGGLRYIQRCNLHPRAKMLAEYDGEPLLALRECGAGLIVVSTAMPGGKLADGTHYFSNDPSFVKAINDLLAGN